MSDLCAKQNVAVALKNTPKGQLSYDSSWNCSFDSLQVCFLPVDSAHLLKKECHMYNLLSRNLEHLIAAYDYFTDTAWDTFTLEVAVVTHLVTHLVWPHQPENPPGRPRARRISP